MCCSDHATPFFSTLCKYLDLLCLIDARFEILLLWTRFGRNRRPHPAVGWLRSGPPPLQVHVEESLESNYTCLMCMNIFSDPVACAPCGHTFCRACIANTGTCRSKWWCQECGGAPVKDVVPVAQLDKIASKFEFKMGALHDLQSLCKGFQVLEAT